MTKKRFLLTNYGYGCKIFMLLVNTTLYGGTIMDGRNINFDRSIRNLLLYSNIILKLRPSCFRTGRNKLTRYSGKQASNPW